MEFRTIADIQARSALLQGAGNPDSFKEVSRGRAHTNALYQAFAEQEQAAKFKDLDVTITPRPSEAVLRMEANFIVQQHTFHMGDAARATRMLDQAWDRVSAQLALAMPDIASKEFDFVLKNGRLALVGDSNLSNSESSLLTNWLNGQEDLLTAAHAYHDAIRANYNQRQQSEIDIHELRHQEIHGQFANEKARMAFRDELRDEMGVRDLGKVQELESGKIRFRDMLTELQHYRKYGDSWFSKNQPLDENWGKYNNTLERRYEKAMPLAQKYLNGFGVTPGMEMHFRRPNF